MERRFEKVGLTPGIAIVVFGACADMGRKRLAVHVYLLIAFSPPGIGRIEERQDIADEGALALNGDPVEIKGAVIFGVLIGLCFYAGPLFPCGMEIARTIVPIPGTDENLPAGQLNRL